MMFYARKKNYHLLFQKIKNADKERWKLPTQSRCLKAGEKKNINLSMFSNRIYTDCFGLSLALNDIFRALTKKIVRKNLFHAWLTD